MYTIYNEDGIPAFNGQLFDGWDEAAACLRRNVRQRRKRAKFFIMEWMSPEV